MKKLLLFLGIVGLSYGQAHSQCSGTPTPGTASAPASACTGASFNLTLTGATSGPDVTIQWQSSSDGISFSNIAGATTTPFATSATDTTYYQAVVTCTTSGLSSTSNIVAVNVSYLNCYCTSSLHSSNTPCITNVSFNTLNNSSTTCALPAYSYYVPTGSATTTVTEGATLPLAVTTDGNAIMSVWIDFNHSGTYDASEWTQISLTSTAGVASIVNVNIPLGAMYGPTGMRIRARLNGNTNGATNACTNFGSGETEDYVINIVAATPCTGTPTAGNTLSSAPSVCSGTNFTLSVDNPPTGMSGLTFQWQSSPDGLSYTNIAGATNLTYTTSQTAATYYQLVVTCTASGGTVTSTPLMVNMNSFFLCYCNNSYALNTGDTKIDSVKVDGIMTGSAASTCQTYTNYTSLTGIDLQIMAPNALRVRNGSCSGTHYTAHLAVYIDYNQDGDYLDAGEQVATYGPTTGLNTIPVLSINPPLSATPGLTGMRIVFAEGSSPMPSCGTYGYGETEDYVVNLLPSPLCTGTPDAGAAVSTSSNVCSGENFTLTTSGGTVASDYTYQWFESADNVTFSPISGATSYSYTGTITDTMYYYVQVTCPSSGMSDNSDVVTVYFNPFFMCYCEPTYTTGTGFGDYIGGVNLGSINNVTAGAASPYYTYYSTPTTNLDQGTMYVLTVSAGTYGSNDLAAWIDFDQNGIFDASEKLGESNDLGAYPASDSYVFTVPLTAPLGNTTLRVREVFAGAPGIDPCTSATYGETEDYLITITPAPPCVNPPVGGIVSGPASDSLLNTVTYVLTGQQGDNIQWYTSTDSVTFNILVGENNDTLVTSLNGSGTIYYMVVMSSPGCVSDSSNVFGTNVIFNDAVCAAFPLVLGVNGPYSTEYATVEPGEPAPPATGCTGQDGWCNTTLDRTLWFTFTAPASGRVSIHAPDFDAQLALWKASQCSDILTGGATLIAANDDDPDNALHGGVTYSPYIAGTAYCLEPGQTYYVQFDAYSGFGTSAIVLTDLGPAATPAVTLNDTLFCGLVTMDAGNDTIPGISYLWSNGDTNQTTVFNADGIVFVTVTDSVGCKATDSATITNNSPLAGFTSTPISLGVFNFTNTSTPSSSTVATTFAWNFGDGGTSTVENPSHIYTNNGVYMVTLTITNDCGSDAITQTVVVNGIGIAELNTDHSVKVFPNPTRDQVSISSDASIESIEIMNAAGQRVLTMANVNSSNLQLDLSKFERGVYMVNVNTSVGTAHTRITVIR